MSCKYLDKVCAKCGHKNEILTYYYDDDQTDERKFKHFVNFHLYECDECGYMAEDISEELVSLSEIKKLPEYIKAYKYEYLDLELIKENHSLFESYPANVYECYAIYQKTVGHKDKFVQSMFACIRQKRAIETKLVNELKEYDDGMTKEEIAKNKKMQLAIKISYQQNAEEIVKEYENTTKSKLLTAIYIECLPILKRYSEAKEIYNKQKSNFDETLQSEIEEYLMEEM